MPKRGESDEACRVCGAPRFHHRSQRQALCRVHLYEYLYAAKKKSRTKRSERARREQSDRRGSVKAFVDKQAQRRALLVCMTELYRQRSKFKQTPRRRMRKNARQSVLRDEARAAELAAFVDGSVTAARVIQQLRQAHTCVYCTVDLNWERPGFQPSINHRTPLTRGGPHTLDNLTVCCRSCVSMKGVLTAREYRSFLIGARTS